MYKDAVSPRQLRSALATVLALVTLLACSPPALGGGSRGTCSPTGSRTLLATSSARVYTLPGRTDRGTRRVFACLLSTRRPVALGVDPDSDPSGIYHLRLAGRYVGFSFLDCGASCSSSVLVYDLKSGRKRVSVTGVPPAQAPDEDRVADLELSGQGAVAWIGEAAEEGERDFRAVYAIDARGRRTLDSGTDIAGDSLGIAGATVYWFKGSSPASARLRR